jgi:pilus assembly protein CpaC
MNLPLNFFRNVGRAVLMGALLMVCAPQLPVQAQAPAQAAPKASEPPPPSAAPRGQVEREREGSTKDRARGPSRVRVLPSPEKAVVLGNMERRTAGEVMQVALNKTVPLTFERAVRDIVVGNPDIADVIVRAADQVYIVGKTVGDTNIFLIGPDNKVLRRIEIAVRLDIESLKDALTQHLPDESIEVTSVGDSIVLSGQARTDGAAAQARSLARRYVKSDENIVNMMKVRTEQQVLIQVRVAEIQKTALKELGIRHAANAAGTTAFPLKLADNDAILSATIRQTGPTTTDTGFAATILVSNLIDNLTTTFQLLETQGMVRNLAEPNLVAVSGESANLLAGGEYPVPVPGADGTVSIEYKPFGVSLAFVPVVLDSGRISLKLETEVSAITTANSITYPVGSSTVTVRSFTVRRANSTVELPSGGSFMIAGLLQNDVTAALGGVPGIMEMPILGSLFKSTSFQRSETELVILVSALMVKPTDPKNLTLPTDGFVVSNDLSRYLLGRLQETYVRRPGRSLPSGGPQGPIGHIID